MRRWDHGIPAVQPKQHISLSALLSCRESIRLEYIVHYGLESIHFCAGFAERDGDLGVETYEACIGLGVEDGQIDAQ